MGKGEEFLKLNLTHIFTSIVLINSGPTLLLSNIVLLLYSSEKSDIILEIKILHSIRVHKRCYKERSLELGEETSQPS